MLNFLKGRMGGQQQGGGFMQRLQQGIQRPQFQQALGGIGAQMMGLDPQLGMAAAQGMQQRRMGQQLQQAISPIERMKIDPTQYFAGGPGRNPNDLIPQGSPAASRPSFGVGGLLAGSQTGLTPQLSNALGGGAWQDPRLRALALGRTSGPLF